MTQSVAQNSPSPASTQFHCAVRAGFISIGESLHGWCAANGYHQQNVRLALNGQWQGARASEICAEVRSYLAERGVCL